MAKYERFEKVYSQGQINVTEIWVDKETGVNYVFHASGYAGGDDTAAGSGWQAGNQQSGERRPRTVETLQANIMKRKRRWS